MYEGSLSPPARASRSSIVWAITVLGLVLRFWGLAHQSLSMDEVSELHLASQPVRTIVTTMDGFPPLYELVLHGWIREVGATEMARWVSLVFGMLALPAIFLLGREMVGDRVGHWSAGLLAVSPIHIWYSQEIRPYSLYFLLTVLAIFRFVRALRSDHWADWAWYGAALLAGLYTHYYFALLVPALMAGAALEPVARARWRRSAIVHATVVLLSLPLVVFLLPGDLDLQSEYLVDQRPLDLSALAYTMLTFVAGFSIGPSVRELHTAGARESILEVLPWAVLLGPVLMYLSFAGARRPELRRRWWQVAILTVVPLALCGLLAATLGVGYRVRYVVLCVAPFLVLLALGLHAIRDRRWALALYSVLAAVAAAALFNRYSVGRYMNEDTRSAAQAVQTLASRSTPIYVLSGYMAEPLLYYLGEGWDVRPLSPTAADPSMTRAVEAVRQGRPGAPFWVIYSRAFHDDPSGRARQELEARGRLRPVSRFAGIEIYRGLTW